MTHTDMIEALKRAEVLISASREAIDLDNEGQARRNLAFAVGFVEAVLEQLEGGER